MKSTTINGIVYSVGDEVIIGRVRRDGGEERLSYNTVMYYNRGIIDKITPSGYPYVRVTYEDIDNDKIREQTFRITKNGISDDRYHKMMPYDAEFMEKIDNLKQKKMYVQKTFKRLKSIQGMSYNDAVQINTLLDELLIALEDK